MKTFKIINKETEYLDTLEQAHRLKDFLPGTDEYEEREFLEILIKDYEFRMMRVPVLE
ncbi:hypothetical protein GZH53_04860 [Flavihumibacter sp. R14]|nr:hypothetical protein [Flavihumibacter soli]